MRYKHLLGTAQSGIITVHCVTAFFTDLLFSKQATNCFVKDGKLDDEICTCYRNVVIKHSIFGDVRKNILNEDTPLSLTSAC